MSTAINLHTAEFNYSKCWNATHKGTTETVCYRIFQEQNGIELRVQGNECSLCHHRIAPFSQEMIRLLNASEKIQNIIPKLTNTSLRCLSSYRELIVALRREAEDTSILLNGLYKELCEYNIVLMDTSDNFVSEMMSIHAIKNLNVIHEWLSRLEAYQSYPPRIACGGSKDMERMKEYSARIVKEVEAYMEHRIGLLRILTSK